MTSLAGADYCLFNKGLPNDDNPENDCMLPGAWHIINPDGTHTIACDGHLGPALRWHDAGGMHEFGSACNLPGSWYDPEMGMCFSEELGLDLGLLKLVEASDEG